MNLSNVDTFFILNNFGYAGNRTQDSWVWKQDANHCANGASSGLIPGGRIRPIGKSTLKDTTSKVGVGPLQGLVNEKSDSAANDFLPCLKTLSPGFFGLVQLGATFL